LSIIAAVMPILIGIIMVMGGALIIWWILRRINRERARI
jgi:Flp pilus assembly protein TadB